MKLLSTTVKFTAGTIPPGTEECSDAMRTAVLVAVSGPLEVGDHILYLEVRLTPFPHLVNCVVTVREGEAKP